MGRIRKNLSFDEDVLKKGQEKADRMFAGNFSMYVTFLINQDCEGIEIKKKENNKDETSITTLDEDTKNEIDNILGI